MPPLEQRPTRTEEAMQTAFSFLGSERTFSEEAPWFEPRMHECSTPEDLPPLRLDPSNRWWRLTEETLEACLEKAEDHYLTACPDLVESIDTLAALGEPQATLLDMYRKILDAGKALQVVGSRKEDILPLLDAVGGEGVYTMTSFASEAGAEEILAMVELYLGAGRAVPAEMQDR